MILVILFLFLSSAVLKEYFNDYDTNHFAKEDTIPKNDMQEASNSTNQRQIVYVGSQDANYYQTIKEWAGYRRYSFREFPSVKQALSKIDQKKINQSYICIEGSAIEKYPQKASQRLTDYVKKGGRVVFCSLPSYQTIATCDTLRQLLGIQMLRSESVKLEEVRLYQEFMLGGETSYSFVNEEDKKKIDLQREIPWFDISSRTKSYIVGFLSEAEKNSLGLHNEDMPAIVWRADMEDGKVFAVNGDYMTDYMAYGMMDAMIYESEDYSLYSVVNAQNLSILGFPDLTIENEEKLAQVYGFNSQQFCRDILWPSFVASAQKANWKMTSFVSVKQSSATTLDPKMEDMIDYLKYFNEQSTEAGISLGRVNDLDLWTSLSEDRAAFDSQNINYKITSGYVRSENKDKITGLINQDGTMSVFSDLRTIVGQYEKGKQLFSWLNDQMTMQNTTTDSFQHTYTDNLRLKSIQTAFGYSNIQADMYRILWPQTRKDEWQSVAEKMAANIDTYWKPFETFQKTTISQSDERVRNFLNETISDTRTGNTIHLDVSNFQGKAYTLLRTHDEVIQKMSGGTWKKVEDDAYLLTIDSSHASLTLRPEKKQKYQ